MGLFGFGKPLTSEEIYEVSPMVCIKKGSARFDTEWHGVCMKCGSEFIIHLDYITASFTSTPDNRFIYNRPCTICDHKVVVFNERIVVGGVETTVEREDQ